MAKFIHLSLLLATAQLTLVSVTKIFIPNGVEVTFNFSSNWKVEYCCRDNRCKFVEEHKFKFKGVSVNTHRLIIHNPDDESNGNYSCYGDSDPLIDTDLLLCLKITGCQKKKSSDCVVEFSDRQLFAEFDCRTFCSGNNHAEFTNNECHLHSSCKDAVIELNKHPVSGDCFSNSYSGNGVEHDADFQFYKEAKSWIDALEHCQNKESSLVEIPAPTVQASVNSSLLNETSSMPNGAWIGLERSIFVKSVPWNWISGEVVKEHEPWNASFPVDALNHHCGKIIWVEELKQFKWLDACCHEELPFICQRAPT